MILKASRWSLILFVFFTVIIQLEEGKAASTNEFITSVINGGQPYMIVPEDSSGMKQGLYARRGNDWVLIKTGPVLMDEHKGAWFEQLELTKLNGYYYSLAIINGQLTLFSAKSQADVPESVVVLGSSDTPLIEIDTGRPVYSQNQITDVQDVAVYAIDAFYNNSQIVLVSLRGSQNHAVRQEFTFAVLIKANQSGNQIELGRSPMLFDYKFHTKMQLASLFNKTSDDVLVTSPLLSQTLLSKLDQVFARQSSAVGETVSLFKDHLRAKPVDSPLVYSLLKGTVVYQKQPKIQQRSPRGQFSIRQEYDLSRMIGSVVVTVPGTLDAAASKFSMYGLLEVNPNNQSGREPFLVSEADSDIMATVIDDNVYIFTLANNRVPRPMKVGHATDFVQIGGTELSDDFFSNKNVQVQRLGVYNVSRDKGAAQGQMLYSIEVKVDDKVYSQTGILNYFGLPSGELAEKKRLVLMSEYVTADMMSRRLVKSDSGRLLFDTKNGHVTDATMYGQLFDPYAPLVDVVESSNGLVYDYVRAVNRVEIDPVSTLVYEEFKPPQDLSTAAIVKARDGITVKSTEETGGSESVNRFLSGKILSTASQAERTEYILNKGYTDYQVEFSSLKQPIRLTVFAYKKEENATSFYFGCVIEGIGSKKPPRQLVSLKAMGSIGDLKNLFIVQGQGEFSKNFYLLQQSKRVSDSGAVTFKATAVEFSLELTSSGQIDVKVNDQIIEFGEFPDELISPSMRVVHDEDGRPYWVRTPELDVASRKWSVISFLTRGTFLPNADHSGDGPKFDGRKIAAREASHLKNSKRVSYWHVSRQSENFRPAKKLSETMAEAEDLLFSDLVVALNGMAKNRVEEGERLVYLVPAEIKNNLMEFITRHYSKTTGAGSDGFNLRNLKLNLYWFNPVSSKQEDILEHVDQIQAAHTKETSAMFVSPLADLIKADRPQHSMGMEKAFQIGDTEPVKTAEGQEQRLGDQVVSETKVLPHVLYQVEAGDSVSLARFRSDQVHTRFHKLLFGTPEEWAQLKKNMVLEGRYGLFDRYNVVELKVPSSDAMLKILIQYLEQPVVQRLGLKYDGKKVFRGKDHGELSQTETRDRLLSVAVTRAMGFAEEKHVDPFRCFLKFYSRFAQAVLTDVLGGVIDRDFFERILTEVFSLPLNMEILPPDHPVVLAARDDYVQKLSDNGFRGTYDTKYSLKSDVLAQVQADRTIGIPGTRIIIGPPGNGKTRFIKAEIKTLGLREYKMALGPDNAGNHKANAFVLNVGDLVDNSNGSGKSVERGSTGVNVEYAIAHIEHWLTSPAARQGFLYIDDFDKGTDEIKTKLNQFLRRLTDSKDGIDLMSPLTGEVAENSSLRNLVIRVVMNPKGSSGVVKTPREMAIEAMSSEKYKVDESHLNRFRHVDYWDRSNSSGKGAQLRVDFMEHARTFVRDRQRALLLSSELADTLTQKFGKSSDGRNFIGGSINGLSTLSEKSDQRGQNTVFIFDATQGFKSSSEVVDESRDSIANFVMKNALLKPVSLSSWDGLIRFVQLNVEAFRFNILEGLVAAFRESDSLARGRNQQDEVLAPALHALRDHIAYFRKVSLVDFRLNPSDFNITRPADRKAFINVIQNEGNAKNRIPLEFTTDDEMYNKVRILMGKNPVQVRTTRSHILRRAQDEIQIRLEKALASALVLKDLSLYPSNQAWLKQLHEMGDEEYIERVAADLTAHMLSVLPALVHIDLAEMSSPTNKVPAVYELVRMYLIAFERALSNLPWAHSSRFLLQNLENATNDQILIQSANVQKYFFSNPRSLFRPVSADDLIDLVDNIPLVKGMDSEARASRAQRFINECSQLLTVQSVGKN